MAQVIRINYQHASKQELYGNKLLLCVRFCFPCRSCCSPHDRPAAQHVHPRHLLFSCTLIALDTCVSWHLNMLCPARGPGAADEVGDSDENRSRACCGDFSLYSVVSWGGQWLLWSRLSGGLWAEAMGQVTPCPCGLRLFGNALSHHSPRALILCPLRRLSCLPGTQPATMS